MFKIINITIDRDVTPICALGSRTASEYTCGMGTVEGEFQCELDDLCITYSDSAMTTKLKYVQENNFTKELGNIFGIHFYYRMTTDTDSIILDAWNEKLDFINDFKLFKITLNDTIFTDTFFIVGERTELELFIKTLENMKEYNKLRTINEIVNDFMIEELKK